VRKSLKNNESGLILIVSHGGPMDAGTNVLGENFAYGNITEWKHGKPCDGDWFADFIDCAPEFEIKKIRDPSVIKGLAHQTGEYTSGQIEFTDKENIGCRFNVRGFVNDKAVRKQEEYGIDRFEEILNQARDQATKCYQYSDRPGK
jgi:hypothetical protein